MKSMNHPAQPAPSPESLKLCDELYENGHHYNRNGEYTFHAPYAALVLDRHYAALRARCERLEVALLPLMLFKAENCDGQIGWRSQPEAIAGEIRVKHVLLVECALQGTTLAEDARTYIDHKWQALNGAGVINRPQGPCDCEVCRRIRAALAQPEDGK